MTELWISLDEAARFLQTTPADVLANARGATAPVDRPEGAGLRPEQLAELAARRNAPQFAQYAIGVLKKLDAAAASSAVGPEAKAPPPSAPPPPNAPAAAPKPAPPADPKKDAKIAFPCPHCGAQLLARVEHVGMHGVCPTCKTKFTIPRIAAPRRPQ